MIGGGIGGAAGVFIILALLNPFFVNIILINLGGFGELNRKKIIWMVLCYFGVLLLEFVPVYLYKEKYIEFSATLFLTTFLWLFPLSFFTWGRKRNIKRKVYIVIAAITVVVVFLYTRPKVYQVNEALEKELVEALDLKLKLKDSVLLASRLHIDGDTLFGIFDSYSNSSPYDRYFVRNIAGNEFDGYDVEVHHEVSRDIGFKNGNFYKGMLANKKGPLIQKVDANGKSTYLCKSDEVVGHHETKVLNYRDLIILNIGSSRILYYNEKLDRVMKIDSGIMMNQLMDHKLYFYQASHSTVKLMCLDLNTFKLLWSRQIKISGMNISSVSQMINDIDLNNGIALSVTDKQISFLTADSAYLFDAENGSLKWEKGVQRQKPIGEELNIDRLLFDKEHCFLNINNNLYCWSIKSGELKWEVKKRRLLGVNKGKVLMSSLDRLDLFVVNAGTGNLVNRIKNSEFGTGISFIDRYLVFYQKGMGYLYE